MTQIANSSYTNICNYTKQCSKHKTVNHLQGVWHIYGINTILNHPQRVYKTHKYHQNH